MDRHLHRPHLVQDRVHRIPRRRLHGVHRQLPDVRQLAVHPAGGRSISDYFSAQTYGGGLYDIDLHGPDGYLRGFKGDVRTWTSSAKAHPEAALSIAPASPPALVLTLTNSGSAAAVFTIGANGWTGTGGSTVTVAAGGSRTVTLAPAGDGQYDYTVTANVGDGFERRFAGRSHA